MVSNEKVSVVLTVLLALSFDPEQYTGYVGTERFTASPAPTSAIPRIVTILVAVSLENRSVCPVPYFVRPVCASFFFPLLLA